MTFTGNVRIGIRAWHACHDNLEEITQKLKPSKKIMKFFIYWCKLFYVVLFVIGLVMVNYSFLSYTCLIFQL